MNRSGQTVGALIALIGVTKILMPTLTGQFFALDTPVALVALAIVAVAYGVWYGPLRFLSGSSVAGLMGLVVLALGASCIASPTLLGLRGTYLPAADIFLLLESGIVLQMIGLEKKHPETLSPLVVVSVISQLLIRRFSHSSRPAHATAVSS